VKVKEKQDKLGISKCNSAKQAMPKKVYFMKGSKCTTTCQVK